ncbi:MAG TPA: hypothetical protein VHN14_29695 [Kofleriaceae bacterium]|jgi:hypothetical protein|nr:hypothetical protein [Kofleriaceae bacterium]
MRISGFVLALALSFASLHAGRAGHLGLAYADGSKAWTAAKASMPPDAKIVLGFDVATIQKTQLFTTFYPKLRDDPKFAQVLDTMKTACKLDPLAAIRSVVIATSGDQEDGAAYIAVTGLDKAKLSSCLAAAGKKDDADAKISIKQDGNITVMTKGDDKAFFAWIGKDVIVVTPHATDKGLLVKWMGGKGALARSDLGKTLAKVNTSAALWGAGEGEKELETGVKAKGGYGAVTFAKGNLDADVHAVMESADQATKMATTMQGQMDALKKAGMGPMQKLGDLAKGVTVTTSSNELVVKGSFVEKDLLEAIVPLLGMMGGP